MAEKNKQEAMVEKMSMAWYDTIVDLLGKVDPNDWEKPWITTEYMRKSQNYSGHVYRGLNAFFLGLLNSQKGYNYPTYLTANQIDSFNYVNGDKKSGKREKGKPFVHILKGEHASPICVRTETIVKKDTKDNYITRKQYDELSPEERKEYAVIPRYNWTTVFNVDQTNLETARPEMFKKMMSRFQDITPDTQKSKEFAPLEHLIANGQWICPIIREESDRAYYSVSKNEVHVPLANQFKSMESCASTTFHEMAHSTGAKDVFNRFTEPQPFGSDGYAKEELIAELTAFAVCYNYGISNGIKEESAQYVKAWMRNLSEDPDYLKNVLSQVLDAQKKIIPEIDKAAKAIGWTKEEETKKEANELQENVPQENEKKYIIDKGSEIMVAGSPVYRIIAAKTFETEVEGKKRTVHAGQRGGFVSSEKNLSQLRSSWIFDDAIVTGSAVVSGDAVVARNAKVSGEARVMGHAYVTNDASVRGKSIVTNKAQVRGSVTVIDARIEDEALVTGVGCVEKAVISDKSVIGEAAEVIGNERETPHVSGNSLVFGQTKVECSAKVKNSSILDFAIITDSANVINAKVSERAKVTGTASVFGPKPMEENYQTVDENIYALVLSGDVQIKGDTKVKGYTHVDSGVFTTGEIFTPKPEVEEEITRGLSV